ncbi:MAG: N-acetyltransferase [Rubrivivax sp.]|nr:N-acetyltransferase [Rubrivivax sp.]
MTGEVYATRLVDSLERVDAADWDALLERQPAPTPFLRHAYLRALQDTGCAAAPTGWQPQYLLLEDAHGLAAATPLYLKSHSYGEYVFDWAWADAYRRHGLSYYPKLLCAVPFTPVPGTRLMARDAAARRALALHVRQLAQANQLSSAHVLLMDETDREALQAAGWMIRHGVQFHWSQDEGAPMLDFDGLLSRLQRHKRKNIVQERRKVAEAGIRFECRAGEQIDDAAWSYFHECYAATYAAHGSSPYLSREFFAQMQREMPEHWVMFIATQGGERVAASLIGVDRSLRVAYGRYWGCTRHIPLLHFEACYYQPLQWCMANGMLRFEGGAQGEHKMARGLLPTPTASAHWIRDERFAGAVEAFLAREGTGVENYLDELRERTPFKPGDAWPASSSSRG